MKFEERKLADCLGWQLAHSVTCGSKKFAKTTLVDQHKLALFQSAGIQALQVFKLDPGDLDEDQAAAKAAQLISGDCLAIQIAGRGRANVVSDKNGVFLPETAIDDLNALDDAFSAASKRAFTKVSKGDLVATIKLVPYGIASSLLDRFSAVKKMRVTEFEKFSAELLIGGSPLQEKTKAVLVNRLQAVGGELVATKEVEHAVSAYARAIRKSEADLILMLGVSAISDSHDVLPESVRKAGGQIIKVGLPTDPGNLLMLAKLGKQTIIGLPGCARSPALNGFDWVLERFAARLPLDAEVLAGMGTGGLLKEPSDRSVPRRKPRTPIDTVTSVSALLLAAGRSSRSGTSHKLLSKVDDRTVVEHSATVINDAGIHSVTVVTGDSSDKIEALFSSATLKFIHNPQFADGMGTSLAVGVQQLDDSVEFALVYLGDMPFVQSSTIKALLQAASGGSASAIYIPTFNGKRGHPVLWGKNHFGALRQLSGDVGGREIIRENNEKIVEVEVNDPGILIDLDTPEMLNQFGITPTSR